VRSGRRRRDNNPRPAFDEKGELSELPRRTVSILYRSSRPRPEQKDNEDCRGPAVFCTSFLQWALTVTRSEISTDLVTILEAVRAGKRHPDGSGLFGINTPQQAKRIAAKCGRE
jgi:hypothetical protein